jgi:PAS domain S-box-containing protein
VALVRALADHAAAAMANADLIQQLGRSRADVERRAETEHALREIGGRIIALRHPEEVLQRSVDEAARLLGADGARIDILDEASGALYWAYDASTGRRPGLGPIGGSGEARAGEGISGRAISELRAVFTGDYLNDDRFEHASAPDEHVRKYAIRSVVAVPLIGGQGPLGTLTVYTSETDAFTPDDAKVIEALAGQAAIAMTNARLIEELDRSRAEFSRQADAERTLREIAADISALREVEAILQKTVNEALRLLDSDSARIDMLEGDTLTWAFAAGEDAVRTRETGLDLSFKVGEGVAGRVVVDGEAFRTGDYLADERFHHVEVSDRLVEITGFRSVLSAPLRGEAGPLGALSVSSHRVDAYDDAQGALLQALADQAAIAIQNARLIAELNRSRGELARRADAQQSLREIGARITAIRESGPLLQQVVDAAKRLVGGDGSILDLVDREANVLRWTYDSGVREGFSEEELAQLAIPIGVGATGIAVAEGRVISSDDDLGEQFPPSQINDRFFEVTGYRSMIIAPISGESGPLGALEVYSTRPGAFDDEDAAVIRSLAYQAAIAITNARLIQELEGSQAAVEARADRERALRDITARITSLRDPDEILAKVVEESRRLLRSDGAHLTRMSEDGTYLVPVFVAGGMDAGTEEWFRQLEFPLGGGINGLAAEEVRPIWTSDYGADPRIPHEPEDEQTAERLGLRAMAAAPLRAPAGEVIGTLAISYRTPREILEDELDLLQGLADQAAIALTNSNLYELLGESEGRYRHLVQNSPDLVWSIDAEARFTFVSDTCERLTGWRPEDLLGKHFGALVHESSRAVAELDWTADLTAEFQELRGRLNLLHRDGHPIPAEFSAFGTLDVDGRFAGANGSVRDMGERDRLERELRASEERYRFLVENSPEVIYAIDEEGRFTYVSETIRRSLGYDPDELIGKPFALVVHNDTPEASGARFRQLRDDPTLEITSRLDLIHIDGRRLPFEVSSVASQRDGQFSGVHGSARDMSERDRLERDLRRQAGELASSQERAHLARELHDSVTQALFSMTLVTRTTELLVDRDVAAAKEQLGSLRDLQREALAEMRALIFELRPGNIEQDGLLAALKTHTAGLQGRIGLPIVVTSDLSERLPLALEEVLYRISQEALHNVVKHAAARQVTLSIDRSAGGLQLRIVDDGRGFEAASVPDGHLGLAGMRARAEKIGAVLDVTSRPGAGTTIEVTVPDATIAAARAASPPSPVADNLSSAE